MGNPWPDQRVDGWYKRKPYSHFDSPLSFKRAAEYVKQPKNVSRHRFLPFLSFNKTYRRYQTTKTPIVKPDGTTKIEKRRLPKEPKIRPLKITSHIDGYIFAYYAKILSKKYEALIKSNGVGQHVLAYRRGLGTNIHFAKEAFDYVATTQNCVAVTMDVRSFFDSINHAELKNSWQALLNIHRLPADHYAAFKAMTSYSWVDLHSCCDRLGVDHNKLKAGEQICSIKDFRNIVRDTSPSLVNRNKNDFGIPQGSPLSAILSNISMLPLDEKLHSLSEKYGWFYRRYSDDILVVGDPSQKNEIVDAITDSVRSLGSSMDVNPSKTETFEFRTKKGSTNNEYAAGTTSRKSFQYLGFTFNGSKILIRPGTLSNYWRKALRSARRAKGRAKRRFKNGGSSKILMRPVYEEATHLGKRNFFTYVRRAQKIMPREPLAKQVRGHFKRVNKELRS